MQHMVEQIATRVGAEAAVIVLYHGGKSGVYVSTHEKFSHAESAGIIREIAKELNSMADSVDAGKIKPDGSMHDMHKNEERDEPETPSEPRFFPA